MRNRHGFTIVELAIVIAIMGVLLVLGVAKLNSSQVTARDHERKSDTANIARSMEDYYKNNGGTYPATDKITPSTMDSFFDGLDKAILKAPGQDSYSLIAATSYSDTDPTVDQYIYLPKLDPQSEVNSGGRLCQVGRSTCGVCDSSLDKCRSFTIYYRIEAGEPSEAVKSITSEHQ